MSAANYLNASTGLYTREMLDFLFKMELTRIHRYPAPLSLLHLGFLLGDSTQGENDLAYAIQRVAHVLNIDLRETDVPAHDGNDFLVLMPETNCSGAGVAGRRLLHRLHETRLTGNSQPGQNPPIAVCIGLACISVGAVAITAEDMLSQASAALQSAYQQGPYSLVCCDDGLDG